MAVSIFIFIFVYQTAISICRFSILHVATRGAPHHISWLPCIFTFCLPLLLLISNHAIQINHQSYNSLQFIIYGRAFLMKYEITYTKQYMTIVIYRIRISYFMMYEILYTMDYRIYNMQNVKLQRIIKKWITTCSNFRIR